MNLVRHIREGEEEIRVVRMSAGTYPCPDRGSADGVRVLTKAVIARTKWTYHRNQCSYYGQWEMTSVWWDDLVRAPNIIRWWLRKWFPISNLPKMVAK